MARLSGGSHPRTTLIRFPRILKPRVLTTNISLDDGTASLNLALEVADYFELTSSEARRIAGEVGKAVRKWRAEAAKLGLTKTEIDRMSSAFEHRDLWVSLAN
jgi:serine/threonine-protein kinase HipA